MINMINEINESNENDMIDIYGPFDRTCVTDLNGHIDPTWIFFA